MKITKGQLTQLIKESIVKTIQERKFDPRLIDQQHFTTLYDAIKFVEKQGLRHMGRGSARDVFVLDSKRVLKMANNLKGIAQNKSEFESSKDPALVHVVAKIFNYNENMKWLVSELVRPLSDYNEFEYLTGVPWDMFVNIIEVEDRAYQQAVDWYRNNGMEDVGEKGLPENIEFYLDQPFMYHIVEALTKSQRHLIEGDIVNIGHWGKTADKRIVLLDYGYTEEVWQNHYSE